jgi:hypothetical protein
MKRTVILTTLAAEYQAVREHLTAITEQTRFIRRKRAGLEKSGHADLQT